jgi:hypothetical protein
MGTIEIETDAEAADVLATNFGSLELRGLASNLGVSRERGDTKRQTAERVVAQAPMAASRIIDADPEVDLDASAFRERRDAGTLDEAATRAGNRRLRRRLERLGRAVGTLPSYEAEVEHRDNIVSVVITCADDDRHPLVEGRAHAVLNYNGKCLTFDVSPGTGGRDYFDGRVDEPRKQWRLAVSRLERLYEP